MEKIKKSNRYQRYLFYVKAYTAGCLLFIVVITIIFIPDFIKPVAGYNAKAMFLGGVIAILVLFLPFIMIYIIKSQKLVKNVQKYTEYSATIINVESSIYLRTDYKTVTLTIPDLNKEFTTKFYKGVLYDEAIKNAKCSVLIDETNEGDILILDIQ